MDSYAVSPSLPEGLILDARFGKGDWVIAQEDPSIYLNHALITERKLDHATVEEAAGEADVVYANTWHSMATENKEQRLKDFAPYQVNMRVIEMAKPDVIYMHCLPGYRGEDMVDEVIESEYCVFWDQGENRMHTEKAMLYLLLA